MMFLDCPARPDQEGAPRCGLPAEVRYRFTMRSSDGPIEAAMIRCPSGHWFNPPIESLTWERDQAGTAAAASSAAYRFGDRTDDAGPRPLTATSPVAAARAGAIPRHTRPDPGAPPAVRHRPTQPEQENSRPDTAPAYYLGRPARLWLSATRPRRRPALLTAAQTQNGRRTQPANPDGNTQPEPSPAVTRTASALR